MPAQCQQHHMHDAATFWLISRHNMLYGASIGFDMQVPSIKGCDDGPSSADSWHRCILWSWSIQAAPCQARSLYCCQWATFAACSGLPILSTLCRHEGCVSFGQDLAHDTSQLRVWLSKSSWMVVKVNLDDCQSQLGRASCGVASCCGECILPE